MVAGGIMVEPFVGAADIAKKEGGGFRTDQKG